MISATVAEVLPIGQLCQLLSCGSLRTNLWRCGVFRVCSVALPAQSLYFSNKALVINCERLAAAVSYSLSIFCSLPEKAHPFCQERLQNQTSIVETSIAAAHTRTLLDGRLATRPDSGTDEGNLRSRHLS